MNAPVTVTPALRSLLHQVATGSRSVDGILDTIATWEADMEERERVAIQATKEDGGYVLMATRARGMHLAVLSLGVRLELLLEGKTLGEPASR